jgi:glucosylceramidase
MRNIFNNLCLVCIYGLLLSAACNKAGKGSGGPVTPQPTAGPAISYWVTRGDQTSLLEKQSVQLAFSSAANNLPAIQVDSTTTFQAIDGFGYTLTGGSATLINQLPAMDKTALLRELFSNDENAISVSYLRISIGASDLDANVFSYNDLPAGQTDETLEQFSIAPDKIHLVPVLKSILAIRPDITILATPWSPPVWMKSNANTVGGSLKTEYYNAYARYFVKYIQAMKAEGITIHAVTPQNEPLNPNNNPSLLMTASEQANFIKNNLGPALRTANLSTKIIIYDHNADRTDYPLAILNDPAAKPFIDGSAFHLYAGDINALTAVHNTHPDKNIYFTEQYTASNGSFGGDLKWHYRNVVVGSLRNWSRNVLEWNLANDPGFRPHTNGGCTDCKGAITIGTSITRNVSYYIIAHLSKFVPPGSIRIWSGLTGSLNNVAFKTPEGKKVLVVENDGATDTQFTITYKGQYAKTSLPAGAVATYVW